MSEGVVSHLPSEEVLNTEFETALISTGTLQIGYVDIVADCHSPSVDFSAHHRDAAVAKATVVSGEHGAVEILLIDESVAGGGTKYYFCKSGLIHPPKGGQGVDFFGQLPVGSGINGGTERQLHSRIVEK